MKKISYWAKIHKTQARTAIVVSFIFLNALAFFTGHFLNQIGIFLLPQFLFGCFFIFLIALIAYPLKKLKGTKPKSLAYYHLQKSCDFILAASTFCMIVCLCNRPERLFQFYPQIKAFVVVSPSKDSSVKHYKSISDFYSSLVDGKGNSLKWKERKKLLKEQVREIKRDPNTSKGEKIALIFLSVLAAAGLLFLVAGLACNLSCNGYDGAAAIVGIGGTALVIFLLVLAIRAINGKKRKSKLASGNATTNLK
ncbi:MAG TPA: hypothetical protein VFI29_10130 [Hanamia sp.]|nr:hypothetical protein [Hanamia sp.]